MNLKHEDMWLDKVNNTNSNNSELKCSLRLSSFCFTGAIYRTTVFKNPMTSHEREKNDEMLTATNRTYPWRSVTLIGWSGLWMIVTEQLTPGTFAFTLGIRLVCVAQCFSLGFRLVCVSQCFSLGFRLVCVAQCFVSCVLFCIICVPLLSFMFGNCTVCLSM